MWWLECDRSNENKYIIYPCPNFTPAEQHIFK